MRSLRRPPGRGCAWPTISRTSRSWGHGCRCSPQRAATAVTAADHARDEQRDAAAPPPAAPAAAAAPAAEAAAPGAAAGAGAADDAAASTLKLRARVVSSIADVPAHEWDALVVAQPETNPFLRHAFLHALEASGSVAPEEGWGPQHVLLHDDASGQLLGAVPLYLKGHSQGEYVFDQSWASFSHALGRRWYPKLQSCVPFTPATGSRLLAAPGPLQQLVVKALAQTLMKLTDEMHLSSLHITFPTGAEWATLGALGFQQRRGIQFHWENRGYHSFEDFLADLKQRKRKSIRQERKAVGKQGLVVKRLRGSEVSSELWDTFYEFYLTTIDKWWGRPYLKREFFHMVGANMGDEVLLVVAEHDGETVAGALNFVGSDCIFGRHWGCKPGREYKHLHFECAYHQAIEEAIERGLSRVEAGAQGEHKLSRGLLPNYTYSAHYITDPQTRAAVGKFLERESSQLQYSWQALTLEGSPFKDGRTVEYLVDKLQSYRSLSMDASMSSSDGEGGESAASAEEADA